MKAKKMPKGAVSREKQVKAPKSSMSYVDAMAIKDGFVATPIEMEELCCETNAKYSTKPGPYSMEMDEMDMGSEDEMD